MQRIVFRANKGLMTLMKYKVNNEILAPLWIKTKVSKLSDFKVEIRILCNVQLGQNGSASQSEILLKIPTFFSSVSCESEVSKE